MKTIAPIFLFITIATAVGTGFVMAKRGGEPAPEPRPVAAVNPQPVKTLVSVATSQVAASPAAEVKSTQTILVSPPSASFTGYYAPEPQQYLSVSSVVSQSNQPIVSSITNYQNGPPVAISNYASAPNAAPGVHIANVRLAQNVTTAPGTVKVTSNTPSPTSGSNKVTRALTTNGNASESVSVTSANGNAQGFVNVSQSSSGGTSTGSIFIDVETTP